MNLNDQAPGGMPGLSPERATEAAALVHIDRGVAADLDAWGHAGHLVLLRRVIVSGGDSQDQRCLFWCESCRVWLLARLAEANAG